MMRNLHLACLALGIALSGCDAGTVAGPQAPRPDPSDGTGGEYTQLAAECADGAAECVQACFDAHGVDPADLEACAEEIQACLEANPDDPSVCKDVAESCLGDGASTDAEALAECLHDCSAEFGECVPEPPTDLPEPPDTDGIVECVEGTAECLIGCAEDLAACEPPAIECDPSAFESVAECIEAAAGDPAAIAECLADAGAGCSVPPIDLSCFEDGKACFETCVADIDTCLDP